MKKLIIFATHPIQYQVPLWQNMAKEGINFEVWYFTDFGTKTSFDVQFGKSFSWDLPMLEGYKYRFLKVNENAAPNKGFKGIILREDVKKRLKEAKATHVYINGWQVIAYWQSLWASKALGLTTIFKGESNDLKPENKWIFPLKKFLLTQFFKRINYFLYIGEANKRLYLKYGINTKKLLPGLYCVDNNRFQSETLKLKDKKNKIRAKWGIPENSYCILFSGKFIQKKRPLDIITAVKKLITTHPNLHLLFVGDGKLYTEIKHEANIVYDKEGKINPIQTGKVNLSITGFLNQSEIPHAYIAADCLILPSDYGETWGLVVNEALASGIPAIVSNQCGSAEDLIKPIDKTLIFKTGEIDSLVNAINHLLNNKPARETIKKQISKYSYISTIQSVRKIIDDAI